MLHYTSLHPAACRVVQFDSMNISGNLFHRLPALVWAWQAPKGGHRRIQISDGPLDIQ